MLTLHKFTGVVRQSLYWIARPMRLIALLFALSLLLSMALALRPSQAQEVGFNNEFTFNMDLKGDVVMVGNTLLHCNPDKPDAECPGNNLRPQEYVNKFPASGQQIFNSSSAALNLPAGARIKLARLYWGATLHISEENNKGARLPECGDASKRDNNCTRGPVLRDKVKFRYPGVSNYVDISGRLIGPRGDGTRSYHSFADVTDRLANITGNAAQPLTFTVANVQTARGIQRHAGWNLVIVYEEPASSSTPFRNITVFQGYRSFLGKNGGTDTGVIELRDIKTQQTSPVSVRLWTFGYEGDLYIPEDRLRINEKPIGDDDNYFKSKITNTRPSALPHITSDPHFDNNVGIDIQRLRVPGGAIPRGSSSVKINVSTKQDGLTFGVFALTSDLTAPPINLAIRKTNNLPSVIPGRQITYTVVAENTNDDGPAVNDAKVIDNFPAALLNPKWTCVASPNSKCDAESGGGNINTTVDLLAEGTATFTVTGVVDSRATGLLNNTACVEAPQGVIEPDLEDNCATDSDPLSPTADLAITKTDGVDEIARGAQLTYTIVAKNNGPSAVTGARVSDNFPAAFLNSKWTCTASPGASCDPASGNGNIDAKVGLPPGGMATFTVVGTVANAPDCKLELINIVRIDAPEGVTDPNPGNNSATDLTQVRREADLSITKTDLPDPVIAGGELTYELTAENHSGSCAQNVEISDDIPANTTFVSADASDGIKCDAPPRGERGRVLCVWEGDTAPGVMRTVTLKVRVDSSVPDGSIILNTATVRSLTPDPNLGNNSATAETKVIARFDLCVTKAVSHERDKGGTGWKVTYKITVTNAPGSSDARDFAIKDQFMPTITSPGRNPDLKFHFASPGCKEVGPGGEWIKCDWETPLRQGECRTVEIVYTIRLRPAEPNLCNVASLVNKETEDPIKDVNSENNSARAKVRVGGGQARCQFPDIDRKVKCPLCEGEKALSPPSSVNTRAGKVREK